MAEQGQPVARLRGLLERHRAGAGGGILSVCSAHPLVIEAALRECAAHGQAALIEATSNQVNQFGGYTGLRPADFRREVLAQVQALGLDAGQVLFGGDHLGPNAWQRRPHREAMALAEAMVAEYVEAGFRKIHLDCSMACADDPQPLPEALVAERAARLACAAEAAWQRVGGEAPVYVIGTEVPVPGGAHEDLADLQATDPDDAERTVAIHQRAFQGAGLAAAWPRIVALVVQPGVEFDHHKVVDYRPARAAPLSRRIEQMPGLVYEAHSTDYQTPTALASLVRDHFAILKVGPGATFALRETWWAMSNALRDWLGAGVAVDLPAVVLEAMRREPRHWQQHHDAAQATHDLGLALQFSLSDRLRYHWPDPQVQAACARLVAQWDANPPPNALLSQHLPHQHAALREGRLTASAHDILIEGVAQVLRPYLVACHA